MQSSNAQILGHNYAATESRRETKMTERERFEKWAKKEGYRDVRPDTECPWRYPADDIETAWQAWQAALANPSDKQEPFAPCKCESDEGQVCGRCRAWDDLAAKEKKS
jgi:hypothetical protein